MKKTIATFAALIAALFASLNVFGQSEIPFLSRVEFDLSVGAVQSNKFTISDFKDFRGNVYDITLGGGLNPKYRFDLGFAVTSSLSIGAYIATSDVRVNELILPDSLGNGSYGYGNGSTSSKKATFYGLSAKYQLLPLVFKQADKMRFQLYTIAQVGIVSSWQWDIDSEHIYEQIKNPKFTEYGIGLGLTYKFSKHWSAFAEYNYGHFFNANSSHLRGGLMIRL
jgi:opacity protein-like surface antigen